ncbi:MAG: segregation/condensation protein A [Chloracidobacterium sp.]|uniref:Segregation and condensation protein A n=1 Tax=Chloracidobacterium validum TaxID=2821543 RepID=A0ABX8BCX2_9BACT|nr:segregation/condensation protein A [Chloracidobacterium validum]QUW04549.1 segregation/condensation protein A [Chloracidobacterium validum]
MINPSTAGSPAEPLSPEPVPGDYRIRLEVFEGPLDLLLYLIKRHELDITDIPMARITAEYLAYIQALRELDFDVAGEFLVMAATLIHIKSRMLLPATAEAAADSPGEDPRATLVRQLMEHQRYRAAAEELWVRYEIEQGVYLRPSLDKAAAEEVNVTVFDLLETFKRILDRRRQQLELAIAQDTVTQARKLAELRALLAECPRLNAARLFEAARTKREMVCLFLAILELLREGFARFSQLETFGDIHLEAIGSSEETVCVP